MRLTQIWCGPLMFAAMVGAGFKPALSWTKPKKIRSRIYEMTYLRLDSIPG